MGDTVSELEPPAVDAATLARILGVGTKTVYDLWKAGLIERGAGRLFEIEGNVRRYCEHVRGQVTAASATQSVK
jgi:hypothetical protein